MPYDEYGNLIDEYGNVIQAAQSDPNAEAYTVPVPAGELYTGPMENWGTEGMTECGLTGAGSAPGQAPAGNPALNPAPPSILDQILGHAVASKDEGKAIIDAWMAQNYPQLQGAAGEANDASAAALGDLEDVYAGAGEVAYHDPLEALTSIAAGAKADPAARAAQFDALGRLREWSDPKVTAVEKFLQEQARMREEQDTRNTREAALRSMAARGVRSGGAEMTALLGGQQISSRNRLLSDLGTQAGAVQRAVNATGQHGTAAGQLARDTFAEQYQTGSAADSIAKFNQETSAQYQRDKTAHRVSERDKRVERGERQFGARTGEAEKRFARQGTLYNAGWTPTAAKVAATETGNAGIRDALTLALGAQEAEKARAALEGSEGGRNWLEKGVDFLVDPGNLGISDTFDTDNPRKVYSPKFWSG